MTPVLLGVGSPKQRNISSPNRRRCVHGELNASLRLADIVQALLLLSHRHRSCSSSSLSQLARIVPALLLRSCSSHSHATPATRQGRTIIMTASYLCNLLPNHHLATHNPAAPRATLSSDDPLLAPPPSPPVSSMRRTLLFSNCGRSHRHD